MSDFPRTPEECKRHRWLPLLDLRTGQFSKTELGCWHCGAAHPENRGADWQRKKGAA